MSNIDKQSLRERYSAKPIPKCHICGTEMTIQRMSGSRVTYGCSGAIYDETGCHYAEGRSLADDHYARSRVTVADESDPDVLALLDELEAAEKRIAELEAREVKLPNPHAHLIWIQAGHAPDDYWDDVAVSHSEKDKCCDGSDRYPVYTLWEIKEALSAIGINIAAAGKGE
ncbi:TPA: ead/Ea22-like family protein [Enterobacter hormaechei]